MYPTIILILALLLTSLTIWKNIGMMVESAKAKPTNTITDIHISLTFELLMSIFWGWFYYLTH